MSAATVIGIDLGTTNSALASVSGDGEVVSFAVPQVAKLNNQDVSYFQMIPINFIYNKYNFDYLEMDRGMMYWVIH